MEDRAIDFCTSPPEGSAMVVEFEWSGEREGGEGRVLFKTLPSKEKTACKYVFSLMT